MEKKIEEKVDPKIFYSEKYYDEVYEYRHVMVPHEVVKRMPKGKLLSEREWRNMGVQQSQGWVHYMVHCPEPHILLFRRPITDHVAAKKARDHAF